MYPFKVSKAISLGPFKAPSVVPEVNVPPVHQEAVTPELGQVPLLAVVFPIAPTNIPDETLIF